MLTKLTKSIKYTLLINIMKQSDCEVPKVWEIDLDTERPMISLGIPKELIHHTMYEETELLSVMGFGHMEIREDVENGREYILFRMNPEFFPKEGDSHEEYFKNVSKFIDNALGVLEKAVEPDIIFKFDAARDYKRFWRILVSIDPSLKDDIKESDVSAFMEKDRKGAHICLQWNKDRGVLRVKSRSLNQLQSMFNKAINELIDQS